MAEPSPLASSNPAPLPGLLPRMIWMSVGVVSLVLGGLGIVLPILPTTPFVILAAFAFGKSAPAVARRLETSRLFGPPIADWRANGAIAPRNKAMALTMMIASIGISLSISVPTPVLIVQILCLTLAGTFILTRPGNKPPRP